jgi:hypothetical protein
MINYLYKNSEWFRAKVNKLWHYKSDTLKGTEFVFVDAQGRKYFRFVDDLDIPVIRKGQIQMFLTELSRGLDAGETTMFLDNMEKQIEAALSQPKNIPQVSKYLASLMHLVGEIKLRKDNILHPTLLMDMAAVIYIREDENPFEFDRTIHNEKVATFTKDVSERIGLYNFFVQAKLTAYIPYLKELEQDFKGLYNYLKTKVETENLAIEQFYGTEPNSIPNTTSKN